MPSKKSDIMRCGVCGISIRRDNLENHLASVHMREVQLALAGRKVPVHPRKRGGAATAPSIVWVRYDPSVPLNELINPENSEQTSQTYLRLISRRGTKTEILKRCNNCGIIKQPTWHYVNSTWGEVHLCSKCKPEVFDRSFGKMDALDKAWSGGAFETNKRKH